MKGRDFPKASVFDCFANKSNKIATDCRKIDLQFVVPEANAYVQKKNNRSEIYCHGITQEPFFQRTYAYLIKGRGHKQIINFMHYLRQIGLLNMWNKSHNWAQIRRRMVIVSNNKSNAETVKIHGKVLQIFAIFGFGIGLGMLAFIIENFVQRIGRRNDVMFF